MRAEPNMVTQGPILESFSKPSTNSLITLKITQESELLISAQSLSLNALRIRCSSSSAFWIRSFSLFFILVLILNELFLSIPKILEMKRKMRFSEFETNIQRERRMACLLLCTFLLSAFVSCQSKKTNEADPTWALLPFVKVDSVNPVLLPGENTFYDPILNQEVKWDEKNGF